MKLQKSNNLYEMEHKTNSYIVQAGAFEYVAGQWCGFCTVFYNMEEQSYVVVENTKTRLFDSPEQAMRFAIRNARKELANVRFVYEYENKDCYKAIGETLNLLPRNF